MPAITFSLTESDLVEAQRSWYLASLRSRATLVKLACGILIFTAAASIPLASLGRGAVAGTLVFLGAYAAIILLNWLLFARRARRSFLNDRALRQPITAEWNDEEIAFAGARRFGRTRWSDVRRRIDTPSLILLSRSDRQFNILPRRVLAEADAADLVARIQRLPG